jgi:lysine biosynthesis protein LysW
MSRKCPFCNIDLPLQNPLELKQQVICPNCGLELEVVWLYPLELAKVLDYKLDPNRKKSPKRKSKK